MMLSGTERNRMNFDTALEMANISCLDDFMKAGEHSSFHVEYECSPGAPVESVQVWSVERHGEANLVCDYTLTAANGTPSARFVNKYSSELLGSALSLVLHSQAQFTRLADQCAHGLVCVGPPSTEESSRAAIWRHGAGLAEPSPSNSMLNGKARTIHA